MKCIGNYKDWINPIWLEKILSTPGQPMPREWQAETEAELNEIKNIRNAGYNMNAINWWFYFKHNMDDDLNPPWCKNKIMYWFAKMNPGQFMPLHRDRLSFPTKRYWMAMQDFEAGHIFLYGDNGDMIRDYKMGDVYEFDNATMLHGESNISLNPSVVLHIAEVLE